MLVKKMFKVSVLVLVLAMVSFTSAAPFNVVLVESASSTDDYANYLNDNFTDFTLTRGEFTNPVGVTAEGDALLAADLVIISRHTSSGSYASDAAEVDFWNSLTQPVLLNNGYIARGNTRLGWTNTTGTNDETVGGNETEVLMSADSLFNGITIIDGDPELADLFTGIIRSLANSADIGADGQLLATGAGDHNALIARFVAGDELVDLKAGTTQTTHAGLRIYFGLNEGGTEAHGGIPALTDDGQTVLFNVLSELGMTPVPEPATMLLMGLGGLALLRRKR